MPSKLVSTPPAKEPAPAPPAPKIGELTFYRCTTCGLEFTDADMTSVDAHINETGHSFTITETYGLIQVTA